MTKHFLEISTQNPTTIQHVQACEFTYVKSPDLKTNFGFRQ